MHNMVRRFHLLALFAWEVCVLGSLLVIGTLVGRQDLHRNAVVFFALLAGCGVVIVVCVAFLASQFGRLGGAISGMLCGLLPSAFLIGWASLIRPGFEESAGLAVMSVALAGPSGLGGAIAGLICSWRNDSPDWEECPWCSGREYNCPHCAGTGWILARDQPKLREEIQAQRAH